MTNEILIAFIGLFVTCSVNLWFCWRHHKRHILTRMVLLGHKENFEAHAKELSEVTHDVSELGRQLIVLTELRRRDSEKLKDHIGG